MRRLIASLVVSLNRAMETPQNWNPPYFNDEMGAALRAGFEPDDLMCGMAAG
jgi:hypothetical protein